MSKKTAKIKGESKTDLQTRVQAAIAERIEALKAGQIDRAGVIEAALKDYERNIRIRSVGDYVALSQHQRRVLGIDDKQVHEVMLIDEQAISAAEEIAAGRLKKIRGKQ